MERLNNIRFQTNLNEQADNIIDRVLFAANSFQIYVIPAIRAYSGLPPVRQCSCRAYQKKDFVMKSFSCSFALSFSPIDI